jgi:hypothetical protein
VKKRPTRTEETLIRLEAIRREGSRRGAAEVRAALGFDRSVVVQRAAEVAADLGFDFASELTQAFARVSASEDDPEYVAADAVLKAMAKLGISAPDTYLAALRMRRIIKFGNVDVGAPLRAHAAMALVETHFVSALEEVAPMLADSEPSVRIAAAQALGVLGGSGAAAVLLLALALLRCEQATIHLLEVVEGAVPTVAALAIAALALHKHDESVAARVRGLVDARREPRLREALAVKFAS